jgi:hypothetical protein
VIVRNRGDSWQVVLQTDHADLSAEFARAWAERGPRHDSLELATRRHDDGWAVWERSPLLDSSGKPVDFLEVNVLVHIAFYRACIAAIRDEDPYAGLLNSMHGAGIYKQRYGRDSALRSRMDEPGVGEAVRNFVAEQEAGYDALLEETGADDELRWRDYDLLEVYDRLSLYFCMRDVERGTAEPAEFQGYRLETTGPWRIRLDPYPFAEEPAVFPLVRRTVERTGRPDVLATPTELVEITIEP